MGAFHVVRTFDVRSMESELERELESRGILQETLNILEEEGIISSKIFNCLRPEHFKRLLEETCIKVGQHVLLMEVFDDIKAASQVSVHIFIQQGFITVQYDINIWK